MERSFRPTKRFYLLLIASIVLLALFVVGAIWLMKRVTGNVRKLEQITLYTEVECEAVVVRSERLFTESASETHILLSEGALVKEGDPIAILYPYSYESQLSAICTREATLYTQLQSLLRSSSENGMLPSEVLQYNERIGAVSKQMRAAANGETDPARYIELEARLVKLQEERRGVMLSKLSDESKKLIEDDIAALDTLKQSFETNSASTIYSAYNGYISFYSDANEDNLRDTDILTVPLIKRILNAPSISMDNENFSYRIVTDRTKFYLAFVQSAKSADRLMPGLTYYFTIKGVKGAYQGRIIKESDTAQGVLYVMEVNADVRPILTTRVVEISIQNNATGLYVPLKYLKFIDGIPYIYVKATDGSYQKIAVYIAGSDGKNAVVSARDSNIALFAGLKIRIPPEED